MGKVASTVIFLVFIWTVIGCATPTRMQLQTQDKKVSPITVEGSKPIAFHRVIFKVESGKPIGGHHDGLARVRWTTYNWQSGISVGSDEFQIAASEELRRFGYTVLGVENLLFGEDSSDKARYQLGGIIQDIEYNTYGPLAGGFSEAHIQVGWQVQDSLKKDIIFTSMTDGYGKQTGTAPGVIMLAFRNAIHQLMGNRDFAGALDYTGEDNVNKPQFVEVIKVLIPRPDNPLVLPNDIEKLMEGVVLIKAGKTHASGFIVSSDGYALTAAHVVTGIKDVSVQMRLGLELNARVLRVDEPQDIALIKIEGRGHKPLALQLEQDPQIGTELFAIGAPVSEKLSFSVTKGVVSGFREKEQFKYIQTDASLNPGNSGGPLIDGNGKVVGIVSWKIEGVQNFVSVNQS